MIWFNISFTNMITENFGLTKQLKRLQIYLQLTRIGLLVGSSKKKSQCTPEFSCLKTQLLGLPPHTTFGIGLLLLMLLSTMGLANANAKQPIVMAV